MPRYTYWCRACEENFELFRTLGDAPLGEVARSTCPKCGAECGQDFSAKGGYVQPDSFKAPKFVASLEGTPTVESRSELKRAMKYHDRINGTRLVEAG